MWNYRLCKKTHRTDENDPDKIICVSYEIHEAYYNDDGEIWAVTEDAVTVGAYMEYIDRLDETEEEKLVELAQTLGWMQLALAKGIIDLDTYVFADQDPCDETLDEEASEFLEHALLGHEEDDFIELTDPEEDSEDN